jgi:SAM-dependent methyltransferase
MKDPASGEGFASGEGSSSAGRYYKRDFWSEENLKYAQPHFRLEKSARIINRIAPQKECDLLDVGCGPAALMHLLRKNIHYYGIDIAIHDAAPNLMETDFIESPIKFDGKKFDIVIAQGVFEYVGDAQSQKFAEISELLKREGIFIASYVNFRHRNKHIYAPYSNTQPIADFRRSLGGYFNIDRSFPTSHNWHHDEPGRKFIKAVQMHLNINIPLVSPALAVEYFFICSPRHTKEIPLRS